MKKLDQPKGSEPHQTQPEHTPLRNTQAAYWDQRYASTPWAYGVEPNDFLQTELKRLSTAWGTFKGRRALCLADGEGRNGVFLASLGFTVTCLDFSTLARQKALALAKERGVELSYHTVDLNDYEPSENHWDLIVSIFFQPPTPTRERLFGRLATVLKPDGRFILEAKHEPDDSQGPSTNRYPGLHTLRSNLSSLHEVWGLEGTRVLDEGPYHQGTQSVVQFHAKKMA